MANPSPYLIQDHNISIHYDGASLVGKNGISKAQKKGGGLGGRKALNDISNSAKPSALQTSKKNNSANVISIGKDDASRNKISAGRKDNYSKGVEKKGGRKALGDLTNSNKSSLPEEKFLHNHQDCIKAQRKAMDMSCFLKEVGLDHDDVHVHLGASPHALQLSTKSKSSTYRPESPMKHYVEVEEMPELLIYDQVHRNEDKRPCVSFSPCDASPKSAKPLYTSWKDDSVLDFALIGTPLQPKH
ncbi:uncharacterized protein LOC132062640 isoform X2 [Lycium ferocissimum]|uniref:uncharacterized protein LOC132062640 isoform X2 n=1 Tax=Lycium ferocissimum TaxID=112874 RepID=UPI00281517C6|nr:uncharacterized protein LOC132062640 isoform X2 [Lycium ferocissimum]